VGGMEGGMLREIGSGWGMEREGGREGDRARESKRANQDAATEQLIFGDVSRGAAAQADPQHL
jgi:hypothetical protein